MRRSKRNVGVTHVTERPFSCAELYTPAGGRLKPGSRIESRRRLHRRELRERLLMGQWPAVGTTRRPGRRYEPQAPRPSSSGTREPRIRRAEVGARGRDVVQPRIPLLHPRRSVPHRRRDGRRLDPWRGDVNDLLDVFGTSSRRPSAAVAGLQTRRATTLVVDHRTERGSRARYGGREGPSRGGGPPTSWTPGWTRTSASRLGVVRPPSGSR